MDYIIIRNMIQCNVCGEVIESYSVHDFKFCSCGKVAVDGGHEYLRRVGSPEDWIELSEVKRVQKPFTLGLRRKDGQEK